MSIKHYSFVLVALLGSSSLFAQNTRTFTFPPVGLGSTETAQVIAINTATNSSNGTAASCTGTISFLTAAGTTVGSTPFTLAAGAISDVHLPFSASGGTGPRTVVRAVVQLTVPTASPRPPCSLEFSFETFDTTTGATHFVASGNEAPIGGR